MTKTIEDMEFKTMTGSSGGEDEQEMSGGGGGSGDCGQQQQHSSTTSSSTSSRCPSRQNSLLVRDGSDKSGKKSSGKSVSFHSATSLPTERKIASVDDCLTYMIAGTSLLKIRSSSRQYNRFFTLLDDYSGIRWTPTSKKSNKALLPLSSIREIRTDILRDHSGGGGIGGGSGITVGGGSGGGGSGATGGTVYSSDCSFSIVYGDNYESLDLVASTPEEANIWVTGLNALVAAHNSPDVNEDQVHLRDKWLQEVFHTADTSDTGFLSEDEVVSTVMTINRHLTAARVHQKIAEMESQRVEGPNRGKIDCHEFVTMYKEVATRPEIYFLMVRIANRDYLTIEDLQLFLEGEQSVSGVTSESCRQIVNRYETFDESRRAGQLHIDGFTAFLLSDGCSLFDPRNGSVCQDMTHPLTHYFVSTSHNTYLLEDQLKGPSSAEGYVWALNKGCRCIKVDCWDGIDEPVVYHGNTLTGRVSFRVVVAAVKQHAFRASRYPLIVHLENHCSVANQRSIARLLLEEWKDMLFLKKPPSLSTAAAAVQPDRSVCKMSPEEIGSRIILKGRKLPDDFRGDEDDVSEEDEGSTDSHGKRKGISVSSDGSSSGGGGRRKIRLCRELSDLISLSRVAFQGFHHSRKSGRRDESHSLCESTAAKLAHACPQDFVQHNKHRLTRVFPNGSRIDSSNYNPQDFWNCGCQMVALNFQTPGPMLDLHDGRFRQNGGCGYVLKPSIMREPVSFFPGHSTAKNSCIPGLMTSQILRIKVVSGQHLPRPRGSTAKGDSISIDPYVVVQVYGIPADCAEVQTRTVSNEGNCPTFDESFEFQLNLPEVALVRFVVLDDDYIGDDFIGQYTIAFDCLRTGYRHVRLWSSTGPLAENCTLFIHVAIVNNRGCSGGKAQKCCKPHSDIKSVGVRTIDDIVKCVLPSVAEAGSMRATTDSAMDDLRDELGLGQTANIKQCLRTFATRVANGPTDAGITSLLIVNTSGFPELQVKGPVTPHLTRTLNLFDKVLQAFRDVTDNSLTHLETMTQAYEALLELCLETLCVQAGLKGKKLNKALETCAWNMQILRGQIDLLDSCHKECKRAVTQMLSSTDTQLLLTAHANKHKDRSPVISRERPRLAIQGLHSAAASAAPGDRSPMHFSEFLLPSATMPRSPTSPSSEHPKSILKNRSPGPSQPSSSPSPFEPLSPPPPSSSDHAS